MELIQIFLPLNDPHGEPFSGTIFKELSISYTEKFGGATLYKRSPADGFWEKDSEEITKDLMIIFEIMAEVVDPDYWTSQKALLKNIFRQEEILIRSIPTTVI